MATMTEDDTFNMLRRIEYTAMRRILQEKLSKSAYETYIEYLEADPNGLCGRERDKALDDNGWNYKDFMQTRASRIYYLRVPQ